MPEGLAAILVHIFYLYALLGTVFAALFLTRGLQKVDSQSVGSSFFFRLLLFPGTVAFWPLFLKRWVSAKGEPPQEGNPHQ